MERHSRRWMITSSLLAFVGYFMVALHYGLDALGLISEEPLPPITGMLNKTLEPLVAGVRWDAFTAVDSASVKLEESASVERV